MIKINSPYFLYMAEAEGVTSITSTRQTRINAAIKDFTSELKRGSNINDDFVQTMILKKYNLEDISDKEAAYIARKVRQKAGGY